MLLQFSDFKNLFEKYAIQLTNVKYRSLLEQLRLNLQSEKQMLSNLQASYPLMQMVDGYTRGNDKEGISVEAMMFFELFSIFLMKQMAQKPTGNSHRHAWSADMLIGSIHQYEKSYWHLFEEKTFQTLNQMQVALWKEVKKMERDTTSNIHPDQLLKSVIQKNLRADHAQAPYYAEILRCKSSILFASPDLEAIQIIIDRLKRFYVEKCQKPTQLICYLNGPHGHVELISLRYNNEENCLEILATNSGRTMKQYSFLQTLKNKLTAFDIKHRFFAAQADLQSDYIQCSVYAFRLSGLISQCNFDDMIDTRNHISQPAFVVLSKGITQAARFEEHHQPRIEGVTWLNTRHFLGDKALMTAQSLTKMKQHFTETYGAERAEQLINEAIKKYDLNAEQQRYYPEYIKARRQAPPLKTIAEIEKKLKVENKDDALLLRRAAVFCTSEEFNIVLLYCIAQLDKPNAKGKTALHFALEYGKASHAAKLVQAGANLLGADSDGNTPLDYYERATRGSQLKRNKTLIDAFGIAKIQKELKGNDQPHLVRLLAAGHGTIEQLDFVVERVGMLALTAESPQKHWTPLQYARAAKNTTRATHLEQAIQRRNKASMN